MAERPDPANANLLLCARVLAADDAAFAAWRARYQSAVLAAPGARSFQHWPPAPPDQCESVMVARFDGAERLGAWLHSEQHRALIGEAEPLASGNVIVQLTGQAVAEYEAPQSTTEVIVTDIKPGREAEYRAWAERIQKVQETFPGYLGSFVQPPYQKERGWTTVLRFDTSEHLDARLESPARVALIAESEPLIHGFHTQRVDTSFPGWAPLNPSTGKPPNMWKTASLVLLTLFPVVMLELRFLNPHLRGLPPALATFIGNAISVALTTWPLMPWAIGAFHAWIFPENQPRWLVQFSPLFVVVCYAIEIIVLWRLL